LFWTADRDLRLISVNGLGVSAANVDISALIGTKLTDAFEEEATGGPMIEALRRALEGHECRFELDCAGRHWLGRVEPMGPAGNATGITAAAFDNTDRAFADRSLRLSEQSYRSLIEDAPFAICRATASGYLLQVNRAMVEMLRYESEQELLLTNLISGVFAKAPAYEEFFAILREKGSLQGCETQWLCHDGKEITVSLAGRATFVQPGGETGDVSYLEILAENITERRQLEHQLRQAQKMQAVGQLAGGIAHDFNNLLTVINGQVQMALTELSAGDPLRERLEDVESAADRASKLTRQLLAFGRFQIAETKVLDLNAIVAGMTHLLSRLIGANLELKFVPGKDLGHVSADPAQVEQVLMNLVINAKDASPAGGALTISTANVRMESGAQAGEFVALTVADMGHGMSSEIQARIFEPFFTTKGPGDGTGLGLATVYSIVKQSKGFITVDSAPGSGARFTVLLPRVEAPAKCEPPAAPPALRRGSETILLAEDEGGIRRFASSFLGGLGYRVLTAGDGLEAIQVANANAGAIDLLVTDIIMPHMGGRELAEELRRKFPKMKLLFISGYPGDVDVLLAIRRMGARLVPKPFPSMPAFAKIVRDTLDQAPGN
jgi:PAS domain S-box-containing protein